VPPHSLSSHNNAVVRLFVLDQISGLHTAEIFLMLQGNGSLRLKENMVEFN
jgi:hypothetical protein